MLGTLSNPRLPPPPRDAKCAGLLGGLIAFGRDAPAFLCRVAAENGDIASIRLGRQTMVLISRPALVDEVLDRRRSDFVKAGMGRAKALVGEGLLTSEGDHHDRQRALAQPAFGPDWAAAAAPLALHYADRLAASWSPGQTVDIGASMLWLTGRVITRLLFPDAGEDVVDDIVAALTTELAWLNRYPEQLAALDRLPLPANRQMARARDAIESWAAPRVQALVDGPPTPELAGSGLLARLAAARVDGGGMSARDLGDEVLTLLLAAHERTAMALTWSWYMLATHPAVAQALSEEAKAVAAEGVGAADAAASHPRHGVAAHPPGRMTTASTHGLPLARAVLGEAVRLFPPIWLFARQPLRDVSLGGYGVRKGTWVLISPYVLHRDARYWPDPQTFDPARWFDSRSDVAKGQGAYLPFGWGPRRCLGEGLAWQTGTLVLATIARRFHPQLADPAWAPRTSSTITLRPRWPLKVVLQPA